MAEIAPLNLTTVPYNPKGALPEEDMSTTIRRNRETALKNALTKFQIVNAKENYSALQKQKRTDAFINKHGDMLFNNTSNALDPNSFNFSSPEGRQQLLKQWRAEVGGNYQGFNAFVEMGTAGEQKSAIRNLMAARENFRSDKQYKKWVNQQLHDLPDDERERLFSLLGDDAYGLVSDLYDLDYGWQGLGREAQDIWEDNPFMVTAGGAALTGITALLGARGLKARRLAEKLRKTGKKRRKKGKKKGPAGAQNALVPVGPGGAGGVGGAGGQPVGLLPRQRGLPPHRGPKMLPRSPEDIARRARARAKGLDPDMEISANIVSSGVAPTPMNKVNVLRKEWSDAVKTGALTQGEAKAFNKALDSVLKKGAPIHFQTLLPALREQQGAGNLIRRWGSGAFKWGALPMAGLGAGSAVGGGIGSMFGEKGEQIGDVLGGTAGMVGANAVWNTVSDVVSRRGMPWVMKRIVSKGGPTLALRVLGKGALGTIGGAFSGGLATAVAMGLAVGDLYLIYDILKDE